MAVKGTQTSPAPPDCRFKASINQKVSFCRPGRDWLRLSRVFYIRKKKVFFFKLLRPFVEKIALQTFNQCKVFLFPETCHSAMPTTASLQKTFYFVRGIERRPSFVFKSSPWSGTPALLTFPQLSFIHRCSKTLRASSKPSSSLM